MSTRYEWVMGPTLISAAERTEFHHGKGKLEAVGPRLWLYVGQVRDLELGGIVNWTMRAEGNSANAHLRLGEFITMFPRATDWMRRTPADDAAPCPKGWTFPVVGSSFEQGLVI